MFRFALLIPVFFIFISCKTKPPASKEINATEKKAKCQAKESYRATYTQHMDLIHTRLALTPNWKDKTLSGNAEIKLKPHFYPTDSCVLNARGMEIISLALINENGEKQPLVFEYDSLLLHIRLNKMYTREEAFKISIDYISRPEKLHTGGSAAIRSDKGLYFINADSSDMETPTELWTQGETESNSVWFPTIEDPQQKMTQEIYLTVDTAFTTVSNGLLISTTDNSNGTRTDYWKQSLAAAPYLSMIAVGNFSVVKEKWKHIEVSYYIDPPYKKYASLIFGNTIELLDFFSEKFGIPYLWEKYSQIVVHDYVSGAMENTTAVIHGTNMQQDARDFKDGNYEDYISHELAHHWFGNLVTCESWSNIALNEGFANYSEYLWREFKYGRDNADYLNMTDQHGYLYSSIQSDPPLFRSHYENREDVYDAVSYNKGGRVLHMLRKYVGDDAFFASLKLYLNTHRFGTAEVADLRLAFEKITGEDLNWYFDQWYVLKGYPTFTINYEWDDVRKTTSVIISQKQKLSENPCYKIPLEIDLYYSGKKERRKITLIDAVQHFEFALPVKPDLINVDAEKMLLCTKKDNKNNREWIFQFDNAPLFLDRYESLNAIGNNYSVKTPESDMIIRALNDPFYIIRLTALNYIGELAMNDPDTVKETIKKLASTDSSADVRERALYCLGKYYSYSEFNSFFSQALKDYSYKVAARAFKVIREKEYEKAVEAATILEKDSGKAVLITLSDYFINSKEDKTDFYRKAIRLTSNYSRYKVLTDFEKYLNNQEDTGILNKGIQLIYERAKRPASRYYRSSFLESLRNLESNLRKKISARETEVSAKNDSVEFLNRQSSIKELKLIKDNLQVKINEIEN